MKLDHSIKNNICFLLIEGNIALDGVGAVKAYVKPFLLDEDIKTVIVDFSKISFIDSSGIGLIVSIFKTLESRGAKLGLVALNSKNSEIFSMTRLDKVLSIFDTNEQAQKALK